MNNDMQHLDGLTAEQLRNRIAGANLDIIENFTLITDCQVKLVEQTGNALTKSRLDAVNRARIILRAIELQIVGKGLDGENIDMEEYVSAEPG